ncbi:MAG TPA: DUF4129 domain-containing protein [Thermococcaceae archaeon]|uniref:DUF4129 domain-containing protein n=1 Tax=Thermococcus sibiricus TaxID=172049 RepID=A0A101EMQ5_9EURY|nr:DUF4129 domain-containing protein [Thermococcus sibiricus]KUK18133.1 MAG: Uncharacterized protein XD54_0521 [Thermococcus sibiricus]KUK29040.1 MAG: Uncharacterized protein XD61_0364 [Thermococcus sp. 40_45]HII68136.1 DUF4129 domain-containing protein [Thermococcaceae archaeon]
MRRLLPFVILLLLITVLFRATVEHGQSSFNIEILYLGWATLFFGLLGYAIWFLFKKGIPIMSVKRRKRTKGEYLRELIIIVAIVIALRALFSKRVEPYRGVKAPVIKYPKFGFSNDTFTITYEPLPDYAYFIPIFVFVVIIGVLLLYRKKEHPKIEITKFDPGITFDTIEGSPEERIIKMYKNVVAGLIERGYPYQKSWTHWEHEDKLKDIFEDLEDLDNITRVFEKAKYGYKLDKEDIKIAKESYEKLMRFLR